ncbi:MAG TPA: hypothetical protein VLB84_05660 [Bacteroidia bacterium]|nr:hypothetical protein [Bacteroidia bacterium]
MKLIFTKGQDNEITVQLTKGTVVENFSYVEMIKQLLEHNKFEDTDFNNINEDEKKRIEGMLQKINEAVDEQSQPDNEQ